MAPETVTFRFERNLGTEGKHTFADPTSLVLSQGQSRLPVQGHLAMSEDLFMASAVGERVLLGQG